MQNYCVYVHKYNGVVVYVGHGTIARANLLAQNSNRGRLYQLFVILYGKLTPEIIQDGLTKEQAILLEKEEFYKYRREHLLNSRVPIGIPTVPKIERLLECFHYSETSPSGLVWATHKRKAGQIAGFIMKSGYWAVNLDGKMYYTHRLVLTLHGVKVPGDLVVDHIDRNRSNNKISNLRLVHQKTNMQNTTRNGRTSGLPRGVSFDPANGGRYIVSVPDYWSEGGTIRIRFSVNLHGKEDALKMAIQKRNDLLSDIKNTFGISL